MNVGGEIILFSL